MKRLTPFIISIFAAFAISLAGALTSFAQKSNFNGHLVNDELGVNLYLNLDEENILIPGMNFLGPTNGYLDGKTNNHVYGVWMLINFHIDGNKVKLRFSNDIGSDSQDIVLTQTGEDTFEYLATGGNSIRKVQGGNRLVKIASSMTLHRVKSQE